MKTFSVHELVTAMVIGTEKHMFEVFYANH
jgi:hypothetical protein